MRPVILILALALLALAACGSSGPGQRDRLLSQCVAGGQTRAACACTLDTATAQGVSLSTIRHDLGLGLSGVDPRLLASALQCENR